MYLNQLLLHRIEKNSEENPISTGELMLVSQISNWDKDKVFPTFIVHKNQRQPS